MYTFKVFILFLLFTTIACCNLNSKNDLILNLRNQVNQNDIWSTQYDQINWNVDETAIIICDMWDKHWCEGANKRVGEMAPKMNEVIKSARRKGITIIHAPSSTMDFYQDMPQRKMMMVAPEVLSSKTIADWYYCEKQFEGELPIDDSDGGCDTPSDCVDCAVWSRQIEAIEIFDEDGISDDGGEINNFFELKGIKNVILMGVHTNMCVLGRPFGIRSQLKLGRNVLLVCDLTDALYNPKMKPYVSQAEGTGLVIEHIEKFWCPSINSSDLLE